MRDTFALLEHHIRAVEPAKYGISTRQKWKELIIVMRDGIGGKPVAGWELVIVVGQQWWREP